LYSHASILYRLSAARRHVAARSGAGNSRARHDRALASNAHEIVRAKPDRDIVNTLITVFGGSGFLGRHVVRALCKRGYRIRVAVRRPELAGHLQPLGQVGQIHAVQANLRYPDTVEAAARGADALINLVGILFERGRQRFQTVQSFGAEAVALAASAHGARLVHVSALGANENSRSLYARSKAQGEKLVLAAVPGATILRPSIVFGPEDDFFNRFAAMARLLPALPLAGGGPPRL